MRYRITSVLYDESELLVEYPILKNFDFETIKSTGYYDYLEAFITIDTLEDMQTLIDNVGCIIIDKECITVYDSYLE